MAIAGTKLCEGATCYTVDVREPSVDASTGEISFPVETGNRTGETEIVQDADWTLYQNGEEIATMTGFSPASGYTSEVGELSGTADLTAPGEFEVEIVLVNWDDATTTFDFSYDLPSPPPEEEDISVSCSSPSEAVVGEDVVVEATVENDGPSSASVSVEGTFGGASETEEVEVRSGGSASVEFTFVPEEAGEFSPEVSASLA
ncbi:MAG: CARDB domain-containing protein [archaeon]